MAKLATYIPGMARKSTAAEQDGIITVADLQTLTHPAQIYGENTLNAGKVTVGKSVHNGEITVNGQNIAPDGENNFLLPGFISMMILSSFGLAAVIIAKKRAEEEKMA